MSIQTVPAFNQGTSIKVVGVGGGGCNAVAHMIRAQVPGVAFVCANTDAQALLTCGTEDVVQLGSTGLGAGAKPEAGRDAAESAVEAIRSRLAGAHMLFITAGMGGGTGTGAAPVIARVAKDMGILTVGVVTKPFDFEGGRRMRQADEGLKELAECVDSLIVVLNERLLEVMGDDVTQEEAFARANDVLLNAVGGISEVIHVPGLVNVDFEDVRTVMGEQGRAMMGTASASGPDRASKAADLAVASPLLEGVDLASARGVLVLIAASKATLRLSETRAVMNAVRQCAAEDAHIIFGTAYDESLSDKIRVTVIATGIAAQAVARKGQPVMNVVHSIEQPRLTGTDGGIPVLRTAAGVNVGRASVWSSARTAAAKVDSLAMGGMDEIEIPAFLRKQAD